MSLLIIVCFVLAIVGGAFLGYMKRSGETIAQLVAMFGVLAILAFGAYLVAIIGGWVVTYLWIHSLLLDAGWAPNRYLLMAMTGLLTSLGYFVIPMIVGSLVTLRPNRAVLLFGFAYCVMCFLLYDLAKPAAGQITNLNTGESLFNCYEGSDGIIELFPVAIRFHPRYPGTPLDRCTAELIGRYEKQQKQLEQGIPLAWVPFEFPQKWVAGKSGNVNLWLEGIQLNDRMTLLYLTCAGRTGGDFQGDGYLQPSAGYVYMADESGHIYRLVEDKANYPQSPSEKDKSVMVLQSRYVKRGEFYRFVFVFPPVPLATKSLTLFHPQFEDLVFVLNPQTGKKPALNAVMGDAPVEWLRFNLDPPKVLSASSVGGSLGQGIDLSVEQVGTSRKGTVLALMASSVTGVRRLYSAKSGFSSTYLEDEEGRKYSLMADLGEYIGEDGGPKFHTLSGSYRFALVFRALPGKVPKLLFHHWQFQPLEINFQSGEPKPATHTDDVAVSQITESQGTAEK